MNYDQFTGHTPSPWNVVKGLCLYVTAPSIPETVMIITGRNDKEAEANVNLIAAAPDLLVENERLREGLRKVKEIARQRFEYGVNPAAAMMLIDIEGLVNAALGEEV
jgi:hypothetical protein